MKVKVAEASDMVLDWLVAKYKGANNLRRNVHRFNNDWILDWPRDQEGKTPRVEYLAEFSPTNSWAQGGPIIEQLRSDSAYPFLIESDGDNVHVLSWPSENVHFSGYGPTVLVAAMRCYVASKLGEEVEVPDELF